ncbi:hypothetical protein HYDPIDRAFT_108487 [Hydnomerulius pinastri MD-312]|nr:hypothetical protein HYDPIDRAFT_108487 [Hydnomerulius pinastri MD-312]
MRFSIVAFVCAMAAYASASALPTRADAVAAAGTIVERDEDGCCKAGGVKVCGGIC